jgi:hypothetical protein
MQQRLRLAQRAPEPSQQEQGQCQTQDSGIDAAQQHSSVWHLLAGIVVPGCSHAANRFAMLCQRDTEKQPSMDPTRRRLHWFTLTVAFCFRFAAAAPAANAPAPMPLAPFLATYQVQVHGITIGAMERRLIRTSPEEFRFESITEATGIARLLYRDLVRETTSWRATATGPTMLAYEYHQTGSKTRQVTITFDHDNGAIHNTVNGSSWDMPIETGVVDKLAYQVLLMLDLAAGPHELRYRIADGGRIKTYDFVVLGGETLTTPAGTFAALKLRRSSTGDDRNTTIWCAVELSFLPIRVDQEEADGGTVSIRLERFQPGAANTGQGENAVSP